MVGLDTSHVVAFTTMLNDPAHEYHLPGVKVVGAYPGGSDLFALSRNRVKGFTENLTGNYGITLYDSIESLAKGVDAIFLESVDGRQHLEQFRRMAIGKPVFIDKPFTTSTADARELIGLAEETGTPIVSCSSLRYAAGISDLVGEDERVVSCEAFGPAPLLEDYPGLFWYGIHGAEMLFAVMGAGCKEVRCVAYRDLDVVVGEWKDGRIGILKGTRLERGDFGCIVHTNTATRLSLAKSTPPYYFFMLQKIAEFFRTGVSPIQIRETFDIIAFLEAAERSRDLRGRTVQTESL
jgi:hypothetical protein